MPGSGGMVWQLLGMLFVTGLVLALAWLATRWIANRGVGVSGFSKAAAEGRLTVLAQMSVGRSERLILVRFSDRCLLLGVTAGQITLLKELTGEEAAQWLTETPRKPSFREALQDTLRRKK